MVGGSQFPLQSEVNSWLVSAREIPALGVGARGPSKHGLNIIFNGSAWFLRLPHWPRVPLHGHQWTFMTVLLMALSRRGTVLFCEACARHAPRRRGVRPHDVAAHGSRN
jgi:hypothetical protein